MSMQWIYLKGEMKGGLRRPELQFIDALMAKKVSSVRQIYSTCLCGAWLTRARCSQVRQLEEDDLGDLRRRDYTLYISLPCVYNLYGSGEWLTPYTSGLKDSRNNKVDRFWRRIQVSGGLPLGVFADKIITPLWGWCEITI